MKPYTPDEIAKMLVLTYGGLIRKHPVAELWNKTNFFIDDLAGTRAGITVLLKNKESIVLDVLVPNKPLKSQAAIIFHELIHVGQQLDLGWFGFSATYAWQWMVSGFSYTKMSSRLSTLEGEAYNQEALFKARLPK